MFLRRAVDHIAKRNWFAVAIEFLIVVVGVFLGLQAQEWNQQRKDRDKERIYVERLAADFSAIDRDLERCLAVYRDSIEAIALVSTAIEEQLASGSTAAVRDGVFADALVRMTAGEIPAGRSATFVEMLSTGDLNILRDAALRDTLVAYDERAQINRVVWQSIREELSAYSKPLYDNVTVSIDLEGSQTSTIDRYDIVAMTEDPGFRSMLNVLAGNKGNVHELCVAQRGRADRVQQALAGQF